MKNAIAMMLGAWLVAGCAGTDSFDAEPADEGGGSGDALTSGCPAPPSATFSASGTVDLLDTAYPIPANAIYVSPAGHAGAPGTKANPLSTVAAAIQKAPAGGTIVLRGGSYHENVTLSKKLTLQAYPHEKPWFEGGVAVTGWVREGSLWRKDGWNHSFFNGSDPNYAEYLDPNYPMALYPDMLFENGKSLAMVGTKAKVAAGKFFVDDVNHRLYIADDPTGKSFVGAALSTALSVQGSAKGTIVRGIGFRHYADSLKDFGAVKTTADDVTFVSNTFAWNGNTGLGVYGTDAVVQGNTLAFNGMQGFNGAQAHNLDLSQNALAYNNQKHIKPGWAGTGMKIAKTYHSVWRNNLVIGNLGTGLWADVSCYDTTILENYVVDNANHGIKYEISSTAMILSNISVGNGHAGINVGAGADHVVVANNTLIDNVEGILVMDDSRVNTPKNEGGSMDITWNTTDTHVYNNLVFDSSPGKASSMVQIQDFTTPASKQLPATEMMALLNYNGYFRESASSPSILIVWGQGNGSEQTDKTLASFSQSTGRELHGVAADGIQESSLFVDAAHEDYRLRSSKAQGKGMPLDPTTAAMIGVASGQPVDLGALTCRQR
jgi:nitrous oxidase accessory protein NosD